ncbi:MAG: tol-pal system protein YbgF [Candidatus Cloacimonadaceae bacterium]|jgi:tol-pal system protein YbgF|nr:tol-pal system protein YbgF [Candidatus Cloacimonadota bacterium]MDY0126682.1 tol-pal system protein YbgF [Candidatus Cloacimonadaceae bacterium]MCB5255576.1 tol-pal system protein YbgF [Candidatus Cloacimonadota bacterium]MCK9177404.1 tol-pal system protein YbgF [Candidatus Cloacimonadota bacterium]MCK9241682.1 tol-pal system protein YbgF [Candidatus Cloacimonadota bacterium]
MKQILTMTLVMILFTGCVSNQAFRKQQSRLQSMEAEIAQNEEELVVLRKEIMQSRRTPGKATTAGSMDQINLQLLQNEEDMKAIIQEQMELSASLGLLTESVGSANQAFINRISDLENRVNMLSSVGLSSEKAAAMASAASSSTDLQKQVNRMSGDLADIRSELDALKQAIATAPETVSSPTQAASSKEQADYEKARDLYYEGNFSKALTQLDQFLADFPSGKYAGNAVYWKGESHYAMGNMPNALREFQNVISRYPKSWKVADAQLKIGMSYMNMGDHQSAKSELNKLKKDYPQYSRMDLVNRFLNELK